MTELSVFIPKELVVTPETLISEQQLPLIPADRLRGIIHPDRLPFLVARQEDVEEAIVQHEQSLDPHPQYATDSDLAAHAADMSLHGGAGGTASNITNSQIANDAAIAWTKIDKTGATAADVGATSALHATDQSIHVPASGLGNNQIASDAAIAWTKISKSGAIASDVGATAIGHTHPTSDIIGLTSGSQFPKTIVELTYTFTQSSNNPAGSYAVLTDGSNTTGAGTTNEGSSIAWLQADLGTSKFIEHFRVQGGAIPNWSSTSIYFDNVTVETSDDASNWMQIHATNTVQTSDSTLKRFFCGYVKARYLRFRRTGYLALAELRIWGFEP